MGYYLQTKFHGNRKGSSIFCVDLTWNDPHVTSLVTLDCYSSYSEPQEHTHSFTMCHLEETELRIRSNTDNDVSP